MQKKNRKLIIAGALLAITLSGLVTADFSTIRNVDALRFFITGTVFGVFLVTLIQHFGNKKAS